MIAHEFGHAIDDIVGGIPTVGLSKELRQVYHHLNDPSFRRLQDNVRPGLMTTPAANGYPATQQSAEYMAEAMRAYMQDPNYLKTVAPKTAARIRAAVNGDPRLNQTIQFNAAVPVVPGLLDAFDRPDTP